MTRRARFRLLALATLALLLGCQPPPRTTPASTSPVPAASPEPRPSAAAAPAASPTARVANPSAQAPAGRPSPSPPPPTAARAAASERVDVEVLDDLYLPPQLTVRVGQMVVWKNYGGKVHDVRGRSDAWAPPLLQPGQAAQLQFSTPGRYEYYCSFHPEMVGWIEVR